MAIFTPNPTCLVNNGSTLNGVDVTNGQFCTIKLFDVSGVKTWSISCLNSDELNVPANISAGMTINQIAKTATFNAPSGGSALIFESIVNLGKIDEARTTFGVYVLTPTLLRVGAAGEQTEGSAMFGWTPKINIMIRAFGSGGQLLAGAGLFISGGAYQVGQNADGSIVVNADDIQLKPAFTTLLTNATSSNTVSTIVMRDSNGDINIRDLNCRNVIASGTLAVTGNTTLTGSLVSLASTSSISISGVAKTGSTNSTAITVVTGSVVNGSSGSLSLLTGNASGTGNSNGISISSGSVAGVGASGNVLITTGSAASGTKGDILIAGRNISLGSLFATFGNGTGVTFIPNCGFPPTIAPVGGGLLFCVAGALWYRGTLTVAQKIANA